MSELNNKITDAELESMSNSEQARLGTELDGVTVAYRKDRFPIPNDPAEKRAERSVTIWFALSVMLSLTFLAVYLFWPWQYKHLGQEGLGLYTLYTPLLGITSGLAILCAGIAAVQYTKKFIPQEISVQERHDGSSSEVDRKTLVALLNDSWTTSTIGRRKTLKGMAVASLGLIGAGLTVSLLGGLIKNPERHGKMTIAGDGTLWTTGWTLAKDEKTNPDPSKRVYLGRDTGAIAEEHNGHYTTQGVSRLVRLKAEDLSAGAMETVFPLTADMVNDNDKYNPTAEVYEKHMHSIHGSRNSVMLIRLRHEDAMKAIEREGQEDYHYGDYYAYSKICTHIGCPTSLYEQQTNRILCPCHQSQFDVLHYGKPIFGPAARALPQLPISVDNEGYLYANGDFNEAVGPAFWNRKS